MTKIVECKEQEILLPSSFCEYVIVGQNPGKSQLKNPTQYPFNLSLQNIYSYYKGYKKHLHGGVKYAHFIASYIFKYTKVYPAAVNLVSCVTKDNKINDEIVDKYSNKFIEAINNASVNPTIICFGSDTFKQAKRILETKMSNYKTTIVNDDHIVVELEYYYKHAPIARKIKLFEMAHPAFVMRFNKRNISFLKQQLNILRKAINYESIVRPIFTYL